MSYPLGGIQSAADRLRQSVFRSKVTITGKIVVAADGKSRTLTSTSTDSAGKKVNSTWVYDKQ
jgi:hypothetical protein